jgi:hypothetical protein
MRVRFQRQEVFLEFGPPASRPAALPQIEGIRIPGGFRQRRAAESQLMVALAGISLVALFVDFATEVRTYHADVVGLGAAVVIFAFMLYQQFTGFSLLRWNANEFAGVFLDVRPWPLRLGEQLEIELLLKRHALTGADRAGARIECFERCPKVNSDDELIEIRRVIALDDIILNPTQRQRLRWTTQIPRDEPASLVVPSASVNWRLIITLYDEAGRSTQREFPLLVLPQVPA